MSVSTSTSKPQPQCTLVCALHGYDDYDVKGLPSVHRVTIPHRIRKGDSFNVYCDGNRKIGGVWMGTLQASLDALATRLNVEASTPG